MVAMLAAAAMLVTPVPDLDVVIDPATGAWSGIRIHGTTYGTPSDDVAFHREGASVPPAGTWQLVSIRRAGATVRVTRKTDDWEIISDFVVRSPAVTRRVFLRWTGTGSVTVTGVSLRSPVLALSPKGADWTLLPGNFPIRRVAVKDMRVTESLREVGWTRGDYGLGLLYAPDRRLSIAAGYRFLHDQARVAVVRAERGLIMEHTFDTLARLESGQEVGVGEQVLHVITGDEAGLRTGVRRMANTLDNGPPADHPADLGRMVLYEVHPWGRLESWPEGDRGHRFDRLTRLLPYYRRLGVNALWLLPVSWPPPWVYTLPAFHRIAPENGTPEQLKGLVTAAHSNGMRVLLDLVVYGIHPDAEEVRRLPDHVWCRDREGKPVRVWGGTVLAADVADPVWQERIRQVVDYWAREYGFDGTRTDCTGWGQTVNWAAPRPNRSVAYGGLQLNKVVRDAFRSVTSGAVTLPEGGKPLVFRNADMVFDYPLYLAMRDLTQTPDLGQWVTDLKAWLEWERAAYPSRALNGLVRFLELHDTVSAMEYFGVGPSQALTAVLAFMEGVPLLQQEQEIGYSSDLARWLLLRNRERCFTHGGARYEAVSSSDRRLLTFVREAEDGAAVVTVNLMGEPISATVRWPADLSRRFPAVWEAFGGTRVPVRGPSARIVAAPYRPFVLLLKPPGRRPAGVGPVGTGSSRWTVTTTEGTLTDVDWSYETTLRPGETVRDVLPPLRRAFRAEELGLQDGRVPPEVEGGPVKTTVNPWFVTLENGSVRLVLARRHGGVPVLLERRSAGGTAVILEAGGDAYADQGFFPNRLYASADGETNPRLGFSRTGDTVSVTFTGILRQRSWNGVQQCAVAEPRLQYRLQYSMGGAPSVRVTMELISPADRSAVPSAFFALRVPVRGLTDWKRGTHGGLAGSSRNVRLGQEGGQRDELVLRTQAGALAVRMGDGLQRLFAIESDGGACHLFLALADGAVGSLPAGQPLRAEATLEIRSP